MHIFLPWFLRKEKSSRQQTPQNKTTMQQAREAALRHFKHCIENFEHDRGDQKSDHEDLRHMFNHIATLLREDENILAEDFVWCQHETGYLFKVMHGGRKAFLKIMKKDHYDGWCSALDALLEKDMAHVHPAVFQRAIIPRRRQSVGYAYGYTIVESFGESIEEWQKRNRALIDEDWYEEALGWTIAALRSLHEVGLNHGDIIAGGTLHKGNLLFRENEDGSRDYRLIDFDIMSEDKLRRERAAIKVVRNAIGGRARKKKRRPPLRRESNPRGMPRMRSLDFGTGDGFAVARPGKRLLFSED